MSDIRFKPTFLYIKQHTITGKLYFGKTCKKGVEKYLGSGSYWLKHINKYGKEHVKTLWYCLFYDEQECKDFAINFSKQNNIVESKQWANLVEENVENNNCSFFIGKDPWNKNKTKETDARVAANGRACSAARIGKKYGRRDPEIGKKISKALTGKSNGPHSQEWKEKNSRIQTGVSVPSRGNPGHKYTKIICPHCGTEGGMNSMKRWHFDNCKGIRKYRANKSLFDENGDKIDKRKNKSRINIVQRSKWAQEKQHLLAKHERRLLQLENISQTFFLKNGIEQKVEYFGIP